ncbi:MAG: cation-translocating P-type ATPase [Candidatus Heimdallarchaeota archaeon]|nr:cation-translocating P-type ATPase [Candidatus Heimdallarchaeota archaeon]
MFGKREKRRKKDDILSNEAKEEIAYHAMDTGEVLDNLDVDPINGLSMAEAESRFLDYGPNVLIEKRKKHPILLFLGQFTDILIGLLIVAAIVSLAVNEHYAWNEFGRYIESLVILAIIIMNAIIGFVQEYQAEKSLEELKKMVSKEVRVIRDGEEHIIDSKFLTIGDIVLIEAGEKVPADMRLVESRSLKVDESSLTGESISLSKDSKQIIDVKAVVGDRRNMLFMGTTVTYGRAKAVVVNIGMQTEMGRIATLMQSEKEEQTPLQKNLDKLGKMLGLTIVVICAIVFATVIIKHYIEFKNFQGVADALETALALAVSAVPEGLPAAITLTYAIGVRQMAKQNAIVSRLPAVETLGIVDVICSDKTGTLTKNEMTVTEIRTLKRKITVTGVGYYPEGSFIEDGQEINPLENIDLLRILRTALLCNNAKININKDTKELEIIGDPTEVALITLAQKGGLKDASNFPRLLEIFFDSQRKRMTTVNRQIQKAKYEEDLIAYTKGSPPIILERCNFISIDGQVFPMSEEQKEQIMAINNDMASRALRVLALAFKVVDERLIEVDDEDFLAEQEEKIESDLIFLGLVGMIDPARPEVKDALEKCRTAGIKAVMVTGDQRITAEAIAKDIGLVQGDDYVTVTGSELEEMSEEELAEIIDTVSIFARVSPEHKYRIVSTFQEKGHTVATTGDGVNDAPAVKKAEIGVAMGIQGTDVTREAAQMVLADDNFATIVTAVERGRTIFQNMLKFIRYLIASNFDEILTVFVAVVFLGLKSPYTAIQILWINLVTDGLPAIALSLDPPLEDIMREPPRKKDKGFMRDIYVFSIIAGLLAFGASMIVFVPLAEIGEAMEAGDVDLALANTPVWIREFALKLTGINRGGVFPTEIDALKSIDSDGWYAHARTLNFTMSIVFEMFNVFITRTGFERTTLRMNPFNNKWILASIGVAMGLQMIAVYVPMSPVGDVNNTIFDSNPMTWDAWLMIVGICVVSALIMELSKFLLGKYVFHEWTGAKTRKAEKAAQTN